MDFNAVEHERKLRQNESPRGMLANYAIMAAMIILPIVFVLIAQ